MLKHLISVLTVVSLLVTSFLSEVASAATKAEKEAKQVEKVKRQVAKHGVGEKVIVELKNKQKVNGFVSKIEEDSFVVTDRKTQVSTTLGYRDVAYLGTPMSKGAKVAWIVGISVGVFVLVIGILASMGWGD